MAVIDRLPSLKLPVPVLVVAGGRDTSTPFVGHGDRIAAAIPGATVVHLDTAHLALIETPDALASTLRRFLTDDPAGDAVETLFAVKLGNHRRVLSDEWVDRSLANRTPFNADCQAMITRIAWHEIWGRAGLDDGTRHLLVVAITASLAVGKNLPCLSGPGWRATAPRGTN